VEDILIRKAKISDLPAIVKLLAELIESTENKEGFDADVTYRNCQFFLDDPNSHILVSEANGVIIALANFVIRRTLLHPSFSGLIDEFVVAKDYRGKGVGRQLISAVIEECKELGCCEVEVSTEFTNTNARKFYKSCGLDEVGPFFEIDC